MDFTPARVPPPFGFIARMKKTANQPTPKVITSPQ